MLDCDELDISIRVVVTSQEERVRNGQAFPPGCPVALQLAGFDVWRYSLAERKV